MHTHSEWQKTCNELASPARTANSRIASDSLNIRKQKDFLNMVRVSAEVTGNDA